MDTGKFIESILALQAKVRGFVEVDVLTPEYGADFERIVLKYRDRYLAKIGKVSWDVMTDMFKYVIKLLNKMLAVILHQEQQRYNETCDNCLGIDNIVDTARKQGAI